MEAPAIKRQRLLTDSNLEKWSQWFANLELLQEKLFSGCLCHASAIELQRPLVSVLSKVSKDYTCQFISTISLLCDVALKQQNTGFICTKISEIARSVSQDESIWEILLECLDSCDRYISFVTCKCVASFLLYTSLPQVDQIFEELFTQLTLPNCNPLKLSNALEAVRTIIEFKDEDDHPLDLEAGHNTNSPSTSTESINPQVCTKLEIDLETVENEVKNLCIKSLENWWTRILSKFKNLLCNYSEEFEYSILSFLTLWQALISVKSNLSVIDTKHFYLNVESFVGLLTPNLPAIIWKKIIDIFNEILCYGSTLSLQDSPPEEACNLAHLIIRCVKSRQFLQQLPYIKGVFTGFGGNYLGHVDWEWESEQIEQQQRHGGITEISSSSFCLSTKQLETLPISSQTSSSPSTSKVESRNIITSTIYIGPTPNAINLDDLSLNDSETCNGDKPLLQKFVLLILKCVAVTVMETRDESDCSDAGSGASDDDEDSAHSASESETNDMIIIEKSIRDVLQQLDQFIKSLVPSFHPSTALAEWIVKLFSDQDDTLIEGMLCVLDTYTCFLGRIDIPKDLHQALNPVLTFITFAGTISEDKDTLLDLLMSNETCFLLYLLRFLKFVWKNWSEFISNCGCNLEKIMSLLIRLRMALHRLVEKSLFPYNINPVLRLLEKCEANYENGLGSSSNRSISSRIVSGNSSNISINE